MRVHIEKKFKNKAEQEKYEAKKRAKEILKQKNFAQLTRAEKDELLLALVKMYDLLE